MPRGIYFASATPPLRCRTNLPSRVYLTPATPPLRYGANLPFGVYLAPEAPPLRHTLITVVGRPSHHTSGRRVRPAWARTHACLVDTNAVARLPSQINHLARRHDLGGVDTSRPRLSRRPAPAAGERGPPIHVVFGFAPRLSRPSLRHCGVRSTARSRNGSGRVHSTLRRLS